MCGNNSLNCLIIYHSLQSLSHRYSVSMVVSLHPLTLLTKLDNLIESKKYLMKDQFVICSGQTQMIDAVGVSHQEVQVTPLDRTFQSSSTMPITSN